MLCEIFDDIFVGTCWHSREHNGDHQEHNWTFSGALWNSIMGKFFSIIAASLAVCSWQPHLTFIALKAILVSVLPFQEYK